MINLKKDNVVNKSVKFNRKMLFQDKVNKWNYFAIKLVVLMINGQFVSQLMIKLIILENK